MRCLSAPCGSRFKLIGSRCSSFALTLAWAIARYLALRSGRPRPAAAELILVGAAWGVAAHFLRDIATAPMSFWWPITSMSVQVPYRWYVVALLVIICLGPVRHRKSGTDDRARETELVSGR